MEWGMFAEPPSSTWVSIVSETILCCKYLCWKCGIRLVCENTDAVLCFDVGLSVACLNILTLVPMCVYRCVCVYGCVHMCMCTYVYVYLCFCIPMCICTYVRVQMCICTYVYMYLCICTYVYVYLCMCNLFVGLCTYVRVQMCMDVRERGRVKTGMVRFLQFRVF